MVFPAPAIRKLLCEHSKSASIFLTNIRQPIRIPPPAVLLNRIPEFSRRVDDLPLANYSERDPLKPNHSFQANVYSGFSFGFFLNPTPPGSLFQYEPEAPEDDSRVIRADSVKKKRKKKMNKHKLRKLRKRLRRKT